VNGDDNDNGEIEVTTADTPLTAGSWKVLVFCYWVLILRGLL
jgi:hypothetical protein